MTSSFFSGFVDTDLGLTLPARSSRFIDEFSLRIGDPSRVGVGIEECFIGDGVVRDGERGEALSCRSLSKVDSGRRGVCGDHAGASLASCNILRSLREERLFLRGGPTEDGTTSATELS